MERTRKTKKWICLVYNLENLGQVGFSIVEIISFVNMVGVCYGLAATLWLHGMTEEAKQVAEGVFNSCWTEMSGSNRKSVHITILQIFGFKRLRESTRTAVIERQLT